MLLLVQDGIDYITIYFTPFWLKLFPMLSNYLLKKKFWIIIGWSSFAMEIAVLISSLHYFKSLNDNMYKYLINLRQPIVLQ